MQSDLSRESRSAVPPPFAEASFEADLQPAPPPVEPAPVAQIQPPSPEAQPELDPEFISILRANLHAAGEHAALGHEGPSFRECSRPACLDAAKLIPELEEVAPMASDAELDAILDRVFAFLEEGRLEAPGARKSPAMGTAATAR